MIKKICLLFLFLIVPTLMFSKTYDLSSDDGAIYAQPTEPLNAVKYEDSASNLPNPEDNVVTISPVSNVYIQPQLNITDISDIGKDAELLMFIVINGEGYLLNSFNIKLKNTVIFKNLDFPIDLSNSEGLSADIYYGYKILDSDEIKYNCYQLIIKSATVNNTEDNIEPFKEPEPENLSFQLDNQTLGKGAAFTINNVLYKITEQYIYKLNSNNEFEQVYKIPENTLEILQTYTVAVLNNKAYIIGGLKNDGCKVETPSGGYYNCATNDVWIYGPDNNSLELSDAKINAARDVAASGVVNGKIYLLAGWYPNDKGTNESSVAVFENGQWSKIDYSGTYYPVRSQAYATVGDKIYLIGGCLENCKEQLMQEFDTTTNTFTQRTPMPLDGRHFSGQNACVRQDRYIYVYGGATDFSETIFDDVAVYDTKTDEWKKLDTHLTMPRKDIASSVVNDQLWIFNGATYFENSSNSDDSPHANYNNQTIEVGTFY